jgi:hypothetical protein
MPGMLNNGFKKSACADCVMIAITLFLEVCRANISMHRFIYE